MTLTFDIPNAVATRVTDAFANQYGFSVTLPDGSANPQTKAQFAKQQIGKYIKEVVVAYEAVAAAEAARTAKANQTTTDIQVT